MPAPRKFNFLPVDNESLRKRGGKSTEEPLPYTRIQNPGALVFPKKALELMKVSTEPGTIFLLKFYLDKTKRALGFKLIEKTNSAEVKSFRSLSVKKYKVGQVFAVTSIKPLLNQLGSYPKNVRCEIESYEDNDDYLGFGKIWYCVIPKEETPDPTGMKP